MVSKSNLKWEVKQCTNNYIKGALCKKVKTRKKREEAETEPGVVRHSVLDRNNTFTPRHQRAAGIKRRSISNVGSSINSETQRKLTCTSLFGGSSLYWKYDYEVPDTCWSEYNHIIRLLSLVEIH